MMHYNVMSISFYVSTVLRKKFRLVWNSNSYFAAFFSHLPKGFAQYCIYILVQNGCSCNFVVMLIGIFVTAVVVLFGQKMQTKLFFIFCTTCFVQENQVSVSINQDTLMGCAPSSWSTNLFQKLIKNIPVNSKLLTKSYQVPISSHQKIGNFTYMKKRTVKKHKQSSVKRYRSPSGKIRQCKYCKCFKNSIILYIAVHTANVHINFL